MPDLVKKWREQHPYLTALESDLTEEYARKQREQEQRQREQEEQRRQYERQYAQFQADRNAELADWIRSTSPMALEDAAQQRRLEAAQGIYTSDTGEKKTGSGRSLKKRAEDSLQTPSAPEPGNRLTPDREAARIRAATAGPYTAPNAYQTAMMQRNQEAQAKKDASGWKYVADTMKDSAKVFQSSSGGILGALDKVDYWIMKNLGIGSFGGYDINSEQAYEASHAMDQDIQNAIEDAKKGKGKWAGRIIDAFAAAGNIFGASMAGYGLGGMGALSSTLTPYASQMAATTAPLGSSVGGKIAALGTRMAGNIAGDLLTSGTNAIISASSGINTYDRARSYGADHRTASTAGLAAFMTEYLSNNMFTGTPLEDAPGKKGYVIELIEDIAERLGKKGGFGAKMEKALTDFFGNKVVSHVFDKSGEGLEEVITGVLDPMVAKLTYNKDEDLATFSTLFEEYIGGVLMSVVMGIPETAKSTTSKAINAALGNKNNQASQTGGIAGPLQTRADYAEKSAADPKVAAQAAGSDSASLQRYAAVFNRGEGARQIQQGANPQRVSQTAFLTDEEAGNYYYIWNQQGAKAADAYYQAYLEPVLQQRKLLATIEYIQQDAMTAVRQQASPQIMPQQTPAAPVQQRQLTEREQNPLQFALNKAQNGATVTGQDARAIMEDPQAVQTLRDAGVLTGNIRPGNEGRVQIQRAVQALAEQNRAAIAEEQQETERTPQMPVQNQQEVTQERTAPPLPQTAAEERAAPPTPQAMAQERTTPPLPQQAAQEQQERTSAPPVPQNAQNEAQEQQEAPKQKKQTKAQQTVATQRKRAMAESPAVSLLDLGFKEAGAQETAFIREEAQMDAEERAVTEALRAEGLEPTLFTGLVTDGDGKKVSILQDGNRVALQADNRSRSLTSMAEEVLGHPITVAGTGAATGTNVQNATVQPAAQTQAAPAAAAQAQTPPAPPTSRGLRIRENPRAAAARESALQAGASEETANQVARLAKILDKDIRCVNEPERNGAVKNGWTQDGVIYYNVAAKERPLAWVVGHELTHNTEHAKTYEKLAALTKRVYGKQWDAVVRQEMAARAEAARRLGDDRVKVDQAETEREIVANFFADNLLTNEDMIREVVENDAPTARRILNYLKDLLRKWQGKEPTIERAIDLYSKALKEVAMGAQEKGAAKGGLTVGNKAGSAQDIKNRKYSVQSIFNAAGFRVTMKGGRVIATDGNGQRITEMTEDMVRRSGIGTMIRYAQEVTKSISKAEAQTQVEGLTRLFNLMLKAQDGDMVWRFAGSAMFSAVKSNSDGQYSTTVDFSTVCKKTEEMMRTMSTVMMKTHKGLTKDQIIELQNDILAENGLVPCPVCYVFSRWAGVGGILDNMAKFQKKYDGAEWDDPARMKARIDQLKAATKTKKALQALLMEEDNAYQQFTGELEANQAEQKTLKAERKNLTGKKADAAANAARVAEIDQRLKELDGLNALLKADIQALEKSGAPEAAWLERVRSKPNYREEGYVEEDLLYNLLAADRLAEEKPLAWGYRTSRGPSAGKAILPYSDMRVGDWVLGPKANSAKGANPLFSSVGEQFSKDQTKAIDAAKMKVLAQNLIGGQRYQSTSDFMYDYGLDYLLSFFEGQMLGSKMQTYTKVMEFVNLVASVHGDVNISMMPLDAGYVTEEDGRQHLIYSSVTGANPEAAIKANHLFDNAQLILVGINDQHILLALEDSEETGGSEIGFVIPYHASGASINNFIRGLVENLKETFDERNYKNYEPMQNDSHRKNATATQEARERLRRYLLTGKRGKSELMVMTGNPNGLTDTEMKLLKGRSKDISGMSFEELRDIEKRALAGDKNAIKEYESWSAGFLGDLYKKMWTNEKAKDTYGVRLTGDQPDHIMPHEFWDTRVDREHAYINGFRFRSYCYSLGLTPRFTGINSSGKHLGYGDFSDSKGYWKTLIDRPMYDRSGKYRDQQVMNVTELSGSISEEDAGMLSPEYGREFWGENAQTPDSGVAARAAERYLERNGEKPQFSAELAKGLYRTQQDFTEPMDSDEFLKAIREESKAENYFPKGLSKEFLRAITRKAVFTRTKLYRGIEAAEYDFLLENKFLKSKGEYNFSNQVDQTLADEDPATALAYATSYAPKEVRDKHYEGDMLPGYIIEFVNSPDLNMRKNEVQESYTKGTIDQDYITRIFEINYDPETHQDMVQDVTDRDRGSFPKLGEALNGLAHGEPMFFRDKTTGTILYAVQGDDGWENGQYISEKDPSMIFDYDRMEDPVFAQHGPKMLGISGNESDLEAMKVGTDGTLVPEKALRLSARTEEDPQYQNGKTDKAYRSAVDSGDMETAQRMVDEAARNSGAYTLPNGTVRQYYHGTTKKFTSFDIQKAMHGNYGYGFYFSPMKSMAEHYGDTISAYLMTDNFATHSDNKITADQVQSVIDEYNIPLDRTIYRYTDDVESWVNNHDDMTILLELQNFLHMWTGARPQKFLPYFRDTFGYDGVKQGNETIVWDNKLIKSADPVTYDDDGNIIPLSERFNQEETDIRYSAEVTDGERSAEALEGRLLGSRELLGTPALKKLGVKVSGSVGRYANTEQLKAKNKAAKQLKKAAADAEKRLQATEAEKDFASGIAAMVYDEEDIPARLRRDVVMELADYYFASDSANLDTLAKIRADINAGLRAEAGDLLEEADFKPQSMLKLNERTPERNFRAMFGERGDEITEWLVQPVRENEAEKIRWFNAQLDKVREFEDSRGKKRELTREESALTMKYMEGSAAAQMIADLETDPKNRYGKQTAKNIRNAAENIRNGESAADAAKEFSLGDREKDLAEKYAAWQNTLQELEASDSAIVENAAKAYAELFDQYYEAINDFLVAHGYEPIGYIKGYAPHMQPEATQTLLEKALGSLGINAEVKELPASIAGQTANYKPNKRWNPYFLQRTGKEAEYDIVKAFESYVDYMADIFYHTDDIMRARQMVRWIRQSFAPEEIRSKLDYIDTIRQAPTEVKTSLLRDAGEIGKTTVMSPMDTEAAMQEYVDKLFEQAKNTSKYSNLVMWLENYANILAGKQSFADRGWEYSTGRKSLNFANRLNAAFQKANVAGNLSSVINQTAQLPMIAAELGERDFLGGLMDVVTGKARKGNWAQDSDFLTEKEGKDYLYADNADKFIDALYKPASWMDHLVSTVAVRGAFDKAIRQGKSYEEAMRYADDFGRKLMGSRAKGSRPLAYESKGFFSKMVHMFQVECANSWDHIASDLPYEIKQIAKTQGKGKAAASLAALIIRALLGTFLLNRATEELYGGTPAPFDILGLAANFVASGQGLTTNRWMKKIIDNSLEKMGGSRVFGTKATEGNEEFDTVAAGEELVYNVMNDLPLIRNAAGVLGLGDQTVPLPGASGEFKDIGKAVSNLLKEGVDEGEIADLLRATLKTASQFLPGGRQIRKTAEGAETVIRGGSYKSGKLQYPVEGAADTARALVFGKSATEASRDYWAAGGKALSEKQTGLYEGLLEEGMSRQEAYDTITGYRDEGTLNDFVKWQDSRSKTAGVSEDIYLQFREDTKGITGDPDGKGGTVSGSKKKKIVGYIDGLDDLTPEQKTAMLLDYNSSYSLKDVTWSGGEPAAAAAPEEPTQEPAATPMPTATPEPETPGLTYRGQQYYDGFVAAGIREDAADTLARKLETTDASGHEQWRAIYNAASYSDREKAVTSVMNDGAKRNWELAKNAGCSLDDYISVRENYLDLDENGKQKQSEWNATLDQYTFSTDEAKDLRIKGTLWQILTGSESTKNNPYDKDAGREVIDAKSGGGSGSGSYAPARLVTRRMPETPRAAKPRGGLVATGRPYAAGTGGLVLKKK